VKSKLRVVEGGKKRSIFADLEALRIPPDDEDLEEIPQAAVAKRRQFARYDETWRARILAADPLPSREALLLALVLVAEADFRRQIPISTTITKAARLTRFQKLAALEHLERLGLIAVEWRGRGRVPIVTPLHLGGRPGQR
jgi:hypothetical protein